MASRNISTNELGKLTGWFLALGILCVIFGFALMLMPMVGTIAVDLMFGLLLLIMGIAELALAFLARKWTGFLFLLVGAIVTLIFGGILIFNPIGGAIALTLFIGAFLFVEGLIKIVRALQLKPNYHWEWLIFDGLLSILLGILIMIAWPSDSTWVIGLLFGIDVLFGGISLIMISQAVKQ